MARLDMVLGVLSGLGSLCTGFYIQAAGFSWPFLSASVLHMINLIYVLGILKGPSVQNLTPNQSSSSHTAVAEMPHVVRSQVMTRRFHGIYLLFATSTRRRNTVLLLILSAFVFYKVIKK